MFTQVAVNAVDEMCKQESIMSNSEGLQPLAGIQTQANTNDGGFALPVGDDGTGYELLPSAWYSVAVTGAENAPSKTGKKMLTLTLHAENQQAAGLIKAYLGAWNSHLYIGLCHMSGVDPKAGFPNLGVLKGISGYAYIKLETGKDGRVSNNVTNLVTRDKMIKEGHAIPGAMAGAAMAVVDFHPDDDVEALA